MNLLGVKWRGAALAVMLVAGLPILAKDVEVKSPDGKMKLTVSLDDHIGYRISYDGEEVLKGGVMQMELRGQALGKEPKLKSTKDVSADVTVNPVVPYKHASIRNHYTGRRLNFKGDYAVEVRVYDDAVAYRFVTEKKGQVEVLGEDFTVGVPESTLMHLQQPGGFKTAYEEPYTHKRVGEWEADDRMSTLPVLMETPQGYKILISEANLTDYPCMFLKGSGKDNRITCTFPKVPLEFGEDGDRSRKILKEADYIAKTNGQRAFPWRYFFIARNDKEILEQTMVDKLSPARNFEDVSWVKPGQTSWEWWNGAIVYGDDVDFESGFNMDTYKYYIDFAAQYGIPYILMDEGWALDTRDPYTPNPKVNVHEIIRYGKEKGVGVFLWLTWLTIENHFEAFKTFAEWGVTGLKIDFMDRSDQWMVDYYERVAKEAAKYHLLVDMHGSFKPAGLERIYPNILSYEGVRGMEQMGGCTPDNSLYLPFMRNAVGPMDYTPGAMISMQPEVYRADRPNAAAIGTRVYQMALYVVFESGVQMLADNPTLYKRNAECTEFITSVPVTWDETKVLDAKIGEYVVVAKRKGGKWFIGAITNNAKKNREFELPLDFISGEHTMVYFEDGVNADRQAMDYRKKTCRVKGGDKIRIKLARNGGWAARIE